MIFFSPLSLKKDLLAVTFFCAAHQDVCAAQPSPRITLTSLLHALVDFPKSNIDGRDAGGIARDSLRDLANDSFKNRSDAFLPYWEATMREAGCSVTDPKKVETAALATQTKAAVILLKMKKEGTSRATSMQLPVPGVGEFTLKQGDAMLLGYELVVNGVQPPKDPSQKQARVPDIKLADRIAQEAELNPKIDATFKGLSKLPLQDQFDMGMKKARLDIMASHREFVKTDHPETDAEKLAYIAKQWKEVDENNAENKKDIEDLARQGFVTEEQLAERAVLEKAVVEARKNNNGANAEAVAAQKALSTYDIKLMEALESKGSHKISGVIPK